mgnify:CR=1 FL=1
MGKIDVYCDFCLDSGKYFGWLDDDYILLDCPCGQPDNPIRSAEDARWEEFQKRWQK